jgi:hypothetical protein
MKKLVTTIGILAMVFVLSSCLFVLKGFSVKANSLSPGETTKAQFVLQPYSTEALKQFQFVMVGVDDTADLAVGKATWGTNGKFTGPVPMTSEPALPGVLTTAGYCSNAGLDLSDLSGITFRGFLTPTKVSNKGLVDQKAIVQVVLRTKAAASLDQSHTIVGVTGMWVDNTGSGTLGAPDLQDTFYCTGISTSSLYVK